MAAPVPRKKPIERLLDAFVARAARLSLLLLLGGLAGFAALPLLERRISFDENALLAGSARPTIRCAASGRCARPCGAPRPRFAATAADLRMSRARPLLHAPPCHATQAHHAAALHPRAGHAPLRLSKPAPRSRRRCPATSAARALLTSCGARCQGPAWKSMTSRSP